MFVPVTDIRKIAELYLAGLLWHYDVSCGVKPEYCPQFFVSDTPTVEHLVNQWTTAFAPHMQSGVYGYVTEE